MIYYKEYKGHESKLVGKKKKVDNNIYSLDIETSSYFFLRGKQYNPLEYDKLDEKDKQECIKCSCMYIWMVGINKDVYYGRTWDELKEFLWMITKNIPDKKIFFIHNLAFEFQYLYSVLGVENVFARKSHKVMKCELKNYNIELRCTYFMSNVSLEKLSSVYNLPVEKKKGDLDYTLIRHSETPLTDTEMGYCKYDILVLFYYIEFLLTLYERVDKIPLTSTGQVRRELKNLIKDNYSYKAKVRKSVNTDPHIYNMLISSFQGGYTHACWIYADEILKNVNSYDEVSAYPYVMTTFKYPSTEFKECKIEKYEDMLKNYAYLLRISFTDIKSKYYNNFISASKCMNLRGAKYDNGRIIEAKSFEMIITDVDFKLYKESYDFNYEILESYYSVYNYLPITFIRFILDKYVKKTEYKNVEEKALEYNLEKQRFNALYGMSVTNNIKDEVIFKDNIWEEVELTNDEIIEKLEDEKKAGFLSFSYGVWVTAYARYNLLKNVMKLDEYCVYCDTDSMKLLPGYDKSIIERYNQTVKNRIEYTSRKLNIPLEKFAPKDKKGISHMLGLFELEKEDYQEYSYKEFITQGAKKYAVLESVLNKDTKEIEDKIKITVAGVPKKGSKGLKSLKDFKDGFIFRYEDTGKNLLFYVDNQDPHYVTDYLGNSYLVTDRSGCCILPNSYTLGKALDYCYLISDESSKRSIYKE